MRKKVIGCIFLICFCFLGLLVYFADISEKLKIYNLKSESLVVAASTDEQIPYTVTSYFQKLDGGYEESSKTFYGDKESVVSANFEIHTGFVADESNPNNVLSATLEDETNIVLKLYYSRKLYPVRITETIEKINGVSQKSYGKVKIGEDVSNVKELFVPFGSSIYVEDNILYVGETQVSAVPNERNAQYTYTFDSWYIDGFDLYSEQKFIIENDTIPVFNISYKFERTVNSYEVKWMNEGKLLYSQNYNYGDIPEYLGEKPIKKPDPQYSYTFDYWSPDILPVSADTVYEASYSKTINYYTVKFEIVESHLNYGTLSLIGDSFQVPYGTKIVTKENEPLKLYIGGTLITAKPTASSAQYEYSLADWGYSADTITKDTTISVQFRRIDKTYTVLWVNDKETLQVDTNMLYGSTVEYKGDTPVKPSTPEFTYEFVGWSPYVSPVTKNITYFAQFSQTVNEYNVKWKINGEIVEEDLNVKYGTMPTYDGIEPSIAKGEDYYFVFEGWFEKISPVKKDVTYEAQFSKWYTKSTFDNENRVYLNTSGLRSDVQFKVEEIYENRLFVLPKSMEAVVIYKASLTKGNENYIVENNAEVVVDLQDDFIEGREYRVYIFKDGEIIEPEITVEGTTIKFFASEISTFIVFTEKVKQVNLIWLIILLAVLIVAEAGIFYFYIVSKYREYKRQIELSKVNCNLLVALPLVIRVLSTGQLVLVIIISVLFLAATGFLIYCFYELEKMKKSLPDEEEDFIYIPKHEEEEAEVETCPVYTGPKRDLNKAPRQTYYDTPYRPIYYYQPIPIYQPGVANMDLDDDVNDDEIIVEDGEIVRIHYKRSFMSRIIQGTKEIQDFYTTLRNEISAYPKLKSRVGWEHESIYTSRETIVLIKVKNDMLCVFLALDPSKFNKAKIEFGDVGKIKKYKNVPMLIKIKEEKDLENVIKLLEQICKKNKLVKEEVGNEDYHYEFRTDRELIEEGLIKEVKTYSGKLEQEETEILTDDMIRSEINVSEAKEALTDEQALSLIETIEVEENKSAGTKKTIVNIGTLSRFYEPNEVVDLSSLKTKKIVSKDTGYVKILASGVLDKPLIVVANSYSIDAVKMILLTGGKVTKI